MLRIVERDALPVIHVARRHPRHRVVAGGALERENPRRPRPFAVERGPHRHIVDRGRSGTLDGERRRLPQRVRFVSGHR
jgi:hypothetical protein